MINWDDPVARLRLVERIGHDAYNKAIQQHFKDTTVARVNGYGIRPVNSGRFGRIYMVDGLNQGHKTLDGAKKLAAEAPARA